MRSCIRQKRPTTAVMYTAKETSLQQLHPQVHSPKSEDCAAQRDNASVALRACAPPPRPQQKQQTYCTSASLWTRDLSVSCFSFCFFFSLHLILNEMIFFVPVQRKRQTLLDQRESLETQARLSNVPANRSSLSTNMRYFFCRIFKSFFFQIFFPIRCACQPLEPLYEYGVCACVRVRVYAVGYQTPVCGRVSDSSARLRT